MNKKHKVELFSAGCRLCQMTAKILAKSLKTRTGIEFIVHKASECVNGSCCKLANSYGVWAVPSIVINGELRKVGVMKDFKEINQYLT